MESLRGKRVLVTGGGARLGALLSLGCARAGLRTAIHCHRSGKAAAETAAQIRSEGGISEIFQADLSTKEGIGTLLDDVTKTFGLPDFLVCAHAGYAEGTLLDTPWADWQTEIRLTGASPLLLTRAWTARGAQGAAVFLLDARMTDNDRSHAAYHAAKRMLYSEARLAAIALSPKIRINGAAPGLVLPPPGADATLLKRARDAAPLGRTGTPDALVDAVLFLLRSNFITGQVLFVDGGRNLRGSVY